MLCGALTSRDLGPVGVDSKFVFLQESLVAFQRFWPNPDWGTPENPGCFFTCSFGDVDFFMLDTRTFRADKSLLGGAQLAWLEKGLKGSRASFKVIGAPCRLIGDGKDGWGLFPAEREAFIKWLGDSHITGIVSLAGNQTLGEVTKYDAPAGQGPRYPIFTVGTSTLSPVAEPRQVASIPAGSRETRAVRSLHRVRSAPSISAASRNIGS